MTKRIATFNKELLLEHIEQFLRINNYDKKEFAFRTNIAESTIGCLLSKTVNTKSITLPVLYKICKVLGRKMEEYIIDNLKRNK